MYLAGADDGVALRFFWNGYYEELSLRTWTQFARRGGVILDIGAHTGAYTLAALSSNPVAQTISFEPYFMNYSRLNMNLRGNGFNPANAYMLGIGERSGVMPFSVLSDISYLTSGGSIGVRKNASHSNVQVVALDEFIPQEVASKVKLIKIDVEGFEGACLRGMQRLVKSCRPVIFFECTNSAASREIQTLLTKFNYEFYMVDEAAEQITRVDSLSPAINIQGELVRDQLNRIALPDSSLAEYLGPVK